MSRTLSRRWGALVAPSLALALAGCDPALSWRAQVRNPAGDAIAGANVHLSCRSTGALTTDAFGGFSLQVLGGIPRGCELVVERGVERWHTPLDPLCRRWSHHGCLEEAPVVVVTPMAAVDEGALATDRLSSGDRAAPR